MTNELLTSAAAERNKDPILTVLESVLPASGRVLEIASGAGQHIIFFAEHLPAVHWYPSEPDAANREVIMARVQAASRTNVAPPFALDVLTEPWPADGEWDAIVCINMIHISPWSATVALFAGAARRLGEGGKLVLYGPYLESGTAAQSNLEFDASLKRRNPLWGLRDLDRVTRVAQEHGFGREQVVRMPANNLTVVFSRPFRDSVR